MKSMIRSALATALAFVVLQGSALADGSKHDHHVKKYFSGIDSEAAKVVNQFHRTVAPAHLTPHFFFLCLSFCKFDKSE